MRLTAAHTLLGLVALGMLAGDNLVYVAHIGACSRFPSHSSHLRTQNNTMIIQ